MKRSLSFFALCSCAVLGSAGLARAQMVTTEDSYQSPQRWYLEVKLGPYAPNIDSEFSGSDTAFGHIFGDGTDLMVKGELDIELWRGFGTVAVGGVFGYYGVSAAAYQDNGSDTSPSTSTTTTGSETSLTLLPMSLLAIYRFDWAAEKYRFPLVPFAKLGVNYTIWWINIDDNTASFNGDDASGGTFGWQFNAGVALQLDILEPSAAKTLDVELGINHTYLFFELVHVGKLGSNKLDVGDTTWNGGIALEF